MSPDEYARGVVAMVMKKSPPVWFWHGNATLLVRTLDTLFPRTIWVSHCSPKLSLCSDKLLY